MCFNYTHKHTLYWRGLHDGTLSTLQSEDEASGFDEDDDNWEQEDDEDDSKLSSIEDIKFSIS